MTTTSPFSPYDAASDPPPGSQSYGPGHVGPEAGPAPTNSGNAYLQVIAREILEDLTAALAEFEAVASARRDDVRAGAPASRRCPEVRWFRHPGCSAALWAQGQAAGCGKGQRPRQCRSPGSSSTRPRCTPEVYGAVILGGGISAGLRAAQAQLCRTAGCPSASHRVAGRFSRCGPHACSRHGRPAFPGRPRRTVMLSRQPRPASRASQAADSAALPGLSPVTRAGRVPCPVSPEAFPHTW